MPRARPAHSYTGWKTAQKPPTEVAKKQEPAEIVGSVTQEQWRQKAGKIAEAVADRLGRVVKTQVVQSDVAEQVRRVQARRKVVNGWSLDRLSKGALRTTTDSLIRDIRKLGIEATKLKKLLKKDERDPALDRLQADIAALRSRFADCKWENNKLKVLTEPVVLSKVNFGRVWIVLNLTDPEGVAAYGLPKLMEVQMKGKKVEGYPHPHVDENNKFCFGEGEVVIKGAIKSMRISDAFQIALSVLNTYYSGSAYKRLERWQSCPLCNKRMPRRTCVDCGIRVCLRCSSRCHVTKHVVCSNCRVEVKGEFYHYSAAHERTSFGKRKPKSSMTKTGECRSCRTHTRRRENGKEAGKEGQISVVDEKAKKRPTTARGKARATAAATSTR